MGNASRILDENITTMKKPSEGSVMRGSTTNLNDDGTANNKPSESSIMGDAAAVLDKDETEINKDPITAADIEVGDDVNNHKDTKMKIIGDVGLRKSERVRGKGVAIKEVQHATKGRLSGRIEDDPHGFGLEFREITPKNSMWMKTSKYKSPFVQREVCISKKLTKQEKSIGLYSLYGDVFDGFQVLFSSNGIETSRLEMQSLRHGSVVSMSVINAWCLLLNEQEDVRSSASPLRFFGSTNVYNDCIRPNELCDDARKGKFDMTLTSELKIYHGYQVTKIDIFFFPVYIDGMYYSICIDTKKERLFILDSTVHAAQKDVEQKYESVTNSIRMLLADYLTGLSENNKAKAVLKSRLQVVKMKWADKLNIEDTGVYLMRYVETFMGYTSTDWKCLSSASTPKQLRLLRIRYCAALLSWGGNAHSERITSEATQHYDDVCRTK